MEKLEVVEVALLASVTRIVIEADPTEVGVPEMTPVEVLRVSPAGSDPEANAKVRGDAPPDATIVIEKEVLRFAFVPDEGVVIDRSGEIVKACCTCEAAL